MKHWSNGIGWEIANYICKLFFKKTQNFVVAWRFLSLNVDEVTNIDVYVMQAWTRVQVLLTFQHVVERGTIDDLTFVITQSLMQQGRLTKKEVGKRFI
jgi:hypothetical protein